MLVQRAPLIISFSSPRSAPILMILVIIISLDFFGVISDIFTM